MVSATRYLSIQVVKHATRRSLRNNNKEIREFSPPVQTLDYSLCKIPNLVPETTSFELSELETHNAISKVFSQLNLGETSFKHPNDDFSDSLTYKIPTFPPVSTKEHILDPIINIPRFKFNKNDYKITDEELKNAPSFAPTSRTLCVEASTPHASTPSDLKGVSDVLLDIAIQAGTNKTKKIHGCKYFSMKFWHESHLMGRIRKSKPGLMIITANVNMLNTPGLKANVKPDISLKSYPFKFSVIKSQTRKLVKSIFHKLYFNDESLIEGYDGLYQLILNITPREDYEIKEFEDELRRALNKVKKLENTVLMKEADYVDQRVDWNHIATICKRHNHSVLSPPQNKSIKLKDRKNQHKNKGNRKNPSKYYKQTDHSKVPVDTNFVKSVIKKAKNFKSPPSNENTP